MPLETRALGVLHGVGLAVQRLLNFLTQRVAELRQPALRRPVGEEVATEVMPGLRKEALTGLGGHGRIGGVNLAPELTEQDLILRVGNLRVIFHAHALKPLHLVLFAVLQRLRARRSQRIAIDRQAAVRIPVVEEAVAEGLPGLLKGDTGGGAGADPGGHGRERGQEQ